MHKQVSAIFALTLVFTGGAMVQNANAQSIASHDPSQTGAEQLCSHWTTKPGAIQPGQDAGPTTGALRRLPPLNDTLVETPLEQTPLAPTIDKFDQPSQILHTTEATANAPELELPELELPKLVLSEPSDDKQPVTVQPTKTEQPQIPHAVRLQIRLPREVVSRANSMLEEATTLANRGAHFAARDQFEKTMRVSCQALDAQLGQPLHSAALARGLRAIEEADDFALGGDAAESDLHLGGYIAGHSTPILKEVDSGQITALLAMQAYYRYAIEQLAIAGNDEPICSKTLFSLGRIQTVLGSKGDKTAGSSPKSLAFYHAALNVYPQNGRAANELGVMMARRGRLREATAMFQSAMATEPTAIINLSKIYRQIGDPVRARQYAVYANRVVAANPKAFRQGPAGGVKWVDNQTFSKSGNKGELIPSTPIRKGSAPQRSNQQVATQQRAALGKPNTSPRKPNMLKALGWR